MSVSSPRPAPVCEGRLQAKRRTLLLGCALGTTILVAAHGERVAAQAVNGTPTTASGSVSYSRFDGPPTPGSETVTVNTSTAIINWTPPTSLPPGPYVFLPENNTLIFQNSLSLTDFTVLNRILTTQPSRFDGTVISRLRDDGNNSVAGGTILFSSPGGIIVGATALFDVGNLVLTTLNVVEDGYGNFIAPGGGFVFEGGANAPNAAIVTEAGSRILADSDSSYVALVAPVVEHRGSARVNGSVAYIAGEEVSFSVADGLFDIVIQTGSDNPIPIIHSGSTGGPASGGGSDNHGIYFAAVPKNQAVTMLLSGSVGFDAADNVSVENGVIVLSAGHNIEAGSIGSAADSDFAADIEIDGGSFTSDVVGRATGSAVATASAGNPLAFDGSVELRAGTRAALVAEAGATASVGGDLLLVAQADGIGGEARLQADEGAIVEIDGSATLQADTAFAIRAIEETGRDAQGGTATVLSTGGTISIGGDLAVTATASGERGTTTGGGATGGTARVEADGGTIDVAGGVYLDASAVGGYGAGNGGNATGGTAVLRAANSGGVSVFAFTELYASGFGGGSIPIVVCPSECSQTSDQGGAGRGGTALVEILTLGSVALGDIYLEAIGVGGDGQVAGAGRGGLAAIRGTGTLTADFVELEAGGYGGFGSSGRGGGGDGGEARVEAGVGASFTFTELLELHAPGGGGWGIGGGDAIGGTAVVAAVGGAIDIGGDLIVDGSGFGGLDFGYGAFAPGSSTGGLASVQAIAVDGEGGTISADDVVVIAVGGGGTIFSGGGGGGPVICDCLVVAPPSFFPFALPAGAGQGGTAEVIVRGGDLSASDVVVSAAGVGGPGRDEFGNPGGAGFAGTGGRATVELSGTSSAIDSLYIDARGGGGAGGRGEGGGAGGDGTGGTATLIVRGGEPTLGEIFLDAGGFAGPGGSAEAGYGASSDGGTGGIGIGGSAIVEVGAGGVLTLGSYGFDARGQGGAGGTGSDNSDFAGAAGRGGDGFGGLVELRTTGGTVNVADPDGLQLAAYGIGGTGGTGGATSGDIGPGGAGGAGGDGYGGTASINIAGGTVNASSTLLDSSGFGGAGGLAGPNPFFEGPPGPAGRGAGGVSRIRIADGADVPGSASLGLATLGASGAGGDGSTTEEETAGQIVVEYSATGLTLAQLTVIAEGAASPNGPAFSLTSDAGPILVVGAVDISVQGDVSFAASGSGGLQAGGAVTIDTAGTIAFSHDSRSEGAATLSGASIDLAADTAITGTPDSLIAATGGDATLAAPIVDIGLLTATGDITVSGGEVAAVSMLAGGDVRLTSDGDIAVDFAQAGDDFLADAGGAFTGGTIIANVGSDIIITSADDLRLDDAEASGLIRLTSTGGDVLSDGLLDAGAQVEISAGVAVDVNDVEAGTFIDIAASGGALDANRLTAGGDIDLFSDGDMNVVFAQAGDDFDASAGGSFTGGTVVATGFGTDDEFGYGVLAGGNIRVFAGGDIRLDDGDAADAIRLTTFGGGVFGDGLLDAGTDLRIFAEGDVDVNDVQAGGFVDIFAGGDLDTGGVIAGSSIFAEAGGAATLGTIEAVTRIDIQAASIDLSSATAGTDIALNASGGDIRVAFAQAGDDFTADAAGAFAADTVVTTGAGADNESGYGALDGSNIVVTAGGDLRLDDGDAADAIRLTSFDGGIASGGSLASGGNIELDAAGDIAIAFAAAGDDFLADAGGAFTGGTVTANVGSDIVVTSVDDLRLDNAEASGLISLTSTGGDVLSDGLLDAGTNVELSAAIAVDVNDIEAGGYIDIAANGGALDAGSLVAGGDIDLFSDGDMVVDFAQAGDDFDASAGGSFTGGTVVATGFGTDDEFGYGVLAGSNIRVFAGGDIRLDDGSAADSILLTTFGGGVFGDGLLDAGTDIDIFAEGDVDVNDVEAGGLVDIFAGGDLGTGSVVAGSSIFAEAGGAATLGTIEAVTRIDIQAASIDLSSATAGTDIALSASGGDIRVGFAQAGDDFTADAAGAFAADTVVTTGAGADNESGYGALDGSNIVVNAGGDLRLDDGDAADAIRLTSFDGGIASGGSLASGGNIELDAAGDIAIAFAAAGDDFLADAGGAFTGGTVTANVGSDIVVTSVDDLRLDNAEASGLISLTSTGGDVLSDGLLDAGTNVELSAAIAVDVNDIEAGGYIDIAANGGALDAGSLVAGGDIDLFSDGDMVVDFAQAGDDFDASAGGSFTGGTVVATGFGTDDEFGYGVLAGSNIRVFAGGDIRLDDGDAADAIRLTTFGGGVFGDGLLDAGTDLRIFAEGDVDVNDVQAGGLVDIFAGGDLDTGGVIAGSSIFAEAGGAATLGTIEAVTRIDIQAASIDLASATAGTDIALNASGGDIRVAFAQAGDDFTADAAGAFAADTVVTTGAGADNESGYGALDGSNIVVNAGGDLRLDDGDSAGAIRLTSTGGGIVSEGSLASGGNIELDAAGDISVVFAAAGDDFLADAGGAFTGRTVTANVGSDIVIASVGDLRLDDAEATGLIDLRSSGGSVLSDGLLNAGDNLFAEAGAAIALNEATAGGAIFLDAGADLSATSLVAGADIFAQADGAIAVGEAIAGPDASIFLEAAGALAADSLVAGESIFAEAGSAMTIGEAVAGPDGSILLDAGTSLSADTLVAGDSIFADAGEDLIVGSASANGSIFLGAGVLIDAQSLFAGESLFAQSDGGVRIGEAGAGASLFVSAGGAAELGAVDAADTIFVDAGSIVLASATAGGDIGLNSAGDISVAFAEAGDDFIASAGGSFTGETVAATGAGPDGESGYGSLEGSNIVVEANGNISLASGQAADGVRLTSFDGSVISTDRLSAGTLLQVDAGAAIDLVEAEAGGNIELAAGGDISVVFAAAGDDFLADAGGAFTGGTVTANVGSDIIVTSVDDLRLDTGIASGLIRLTSTGGSVLSDNLLDAGTNVELNAAADIDANAVEAGSLIDLRAGGAVAVATAGSGGSIFVDTDGPALLGTLDAADDIFVDAGSIDLASATAGADIGLTSTGDIAVTFAQAGDDFTADAGGAFAAATVVTTGLGEDSEAGYGSIGDGSNIVVRSGGSLRVDDGEAAGFIDLASSGGGIVSDVSLRAGGDILLDADGDIAIVFAAAGDDFIADAGGTFTADTVTANVGSDIIVTSVGDLSLDTGLASGLIDLASSGGSVLSADLLDAGGDIRLSAALDIDVNVAEAGADILLGAGRDIAASALDAGGAIAGTASGDMALGSANADLDIDLFAAGALTADSLSAGGTLLARAFGDVSVGTAAAGDDLALVSFDGALTLGSGDAGRDLFMAALVSVDADTLEAGRELTIQTQVGDGDPSIPRTVSIGTAVAGEALRIGTFGALTADSLAATGPGGVSLASGTSIRVGSIDSQGNVELAVNPTSPSGFTLTDGRGGMAVDTISAAGDIDAENVASGIVFGDASAGGSIFVRTGDPDPAFAGFAASTLLAGVDVLIDVNGAAVADLIQANGSVDISAAAIDVQSLDGRDITLTSLGGIVLGAATAADDFVADAGGIFTAALVHVSGAGPDSEAGEGALAGSNLIVTAAGDLRLDDGRAETGLIALTSTGGSIFSGQSLVAGGIGIELDADRDILVTSTDSNAVTLTAGGDIGASSLIANFDVVAAAGGDIAIDFATSFFGDVDLDAGGDIVVATAEAGSDFLADAGGSFGAGTVTAGGALAVSSVGDLRLDNGLASGPIQLTSSGGSVLSGGLLSAGTDVEVSAAVDVAVTDATAGGSILLEGDRDLVARDLVAGLAIDLQAEGSVAVRNASAASGDIRLFSDGDIVASGRLEAGGTIDAFTLLGDIVFASAQADVDLLATTDGGEIVIGSGVAGRDMELLALVGVEAGTLQAGRNLEIQTLVGNGDSSIPRTVTLGSATAGASLIIGAFGALAADSLTVTGAGLLFAGSSTSIAVGTMASGGDVQLFLAPSSPSGFALGDGRGGIAVGQIDAAGDIDAFSQASGISFGRASALGSIFVTTADPDPAFAGFVAGELVAGTDVRIDAGGLVQATLVDAGRDIAIDAAAIALVDASADRDIALTASGDIGARNLIAGEDVDVDAGGRIDIVLADAGLGEIELAATGSIAAGTLRAGGSVTVESETGDIAVDLAEANRIAPAPGEIEGFAALAQNGNVSVGSASAANIALAAGGGITAGSLAADDAVLLFAGGDVDLGTVDAGGLFYLGNPATLAAFGDFDDFDPADLDTVPQQRSGGDLTITGPVQAGRIALAAGGAAQIASLSSGSDILLSAASLDLVTATATRDIDLDIDGAAAVGFAQAGDDFRADVGSFAGGTVLATGLGPDSEGDGANIVIAAAGDLRLDNGDAADAIRLTSAAGSVLGAGALRAGDDIEIDAAIDIAVTDVEAGGGIDFAAGRDIVARDLAAIDTIRLEAAGDISFRDMITELGDIVLRPGNDVTGSGRVETGGSLDVAVAGDMAFTQLDVGRDILLASSQGEIAIGEGVAGRDIVLTAAGALEAGSLDAGRDILLGAGGPIEVGFAEAGRDFRVEGGGDGRFGDVRAALAAIDLAGTATFDGATFDGATVAGTIHVASSDIEIGAQGALGGPTTQLVALTVRGSVQTVLGGDAQGPGYTLTDAEADRIRAGTLRILAPPTGTDPARAPDVLVRDLSIDAGRVGILSLATHGIVQVEGDLLLANAGPSNRIDIRADQRLQVVTPAGSIRVRDASGLPGGSLNITANDLWSATPTALGQLLVNPNFDGRDALLRTNTGPEAPLGYIEAADVTLFVRETLFVQNTGSTVDFAGITVVENTLRIVPTGNSPLQVYAFGRRINPDGSFVTNNAFFGEVEFERGYGAGYTDDAQFNLCVINTGICRLPSPDQPLPGGPDFIEEPIDGPVVPTTLAELVDTSFSNDPLIEEPVTSGGDSILWDCDRDDDGDCDEDDRDG